MLTFFHLSLLIIFLLTMGVSVYSFWIGAPIVFSPKLALRQALRHLELPKGSRFCDLGAGTGRTMIIARKEFGLQVTGFELSPPLFLISKINFLLNRTKNTLRMKNFYSQNLRENDAIFCFLTSQAMEKLRPKFEKELKNGTIVISYAFEIKDWKPKKVLSGRCPGKTFIYER
jgi:ribosomal protein L11 methylase PrmA